MAKKRTRESEPTTAETTPDTDTSTLRALARQKIASATTFIFLLVATGLIGALVAPLSPLWAWLFTLALMAGVVIAAGYNLRGFFFGFLIDSRNRYSLSRLQTLVWTQLVLSAYLTAVFVNFRAGALDSLAISIPEELWVLMGISVTSLIGSPLLIDQKRHRATEVGSAEEETTTDVDGKTVAFDGAVAEKTVAEDAGWSDLFKGEDASDFKYLDVSRIQMFYFSFILVVAYSYAVGQMFHQLGDTGELASIDSLPAVSSGMLALLGISHTAYLGNKAIPSPQAPPASSNPRE